MATSFPKKLLTYLAVVAVCITAKAQESKISIDIIPTNNDQYNISCTSECNAIGSFSIYIQFKNTTNMRLQNTIATVSSPNKIIMTFAPINPQKYSSWGSYSYSHTRGRFNAKPDTSFVYRLPVSTSKVTQIPKYPDKVQEFDGKISNTDWNPLYFDMKKGDTVFAARHGLVVEIGEKIGLMHSSNFIIVEHDDGTLGRYYSLEKGSAMVAKGDIVYPNTPLALAGSNNGITYAMYFYITYIILDRQTVNELDRFDTKFIYPIFATTSGECKLQPDTQYTPVVTPELIEMEMSKKEKAKRK